MKKILFASFVLLGIIGLFAISDSFAKSRYDASTMLEAPSAGGYMVGLQRGAAVLAVYASSDTDSSLTNWFTLWDTTSTNLTAASSYQRCPAMYFPISTTTVNAAGYVTTLNKIADFGDEGISFSTAPYLHKTASTSGQALRVWLKVIQ